MKTKWIFCGRFIAVQAVVIIFLAGCSTAPVTGRHQLSLVSAGDETQLGLNSFNQMKTNTPINHDPAVNAMVQRVGERIAKVANKDMPNAQWEFVVFESKEANAFCLPGGKVGVYSGLLPITKDDAGLATVIGHEVGHAVAHHGAERMSEAMVITKAGQYLGSAVSSQGELTQTATMMAYGGATKYGRELPHSRAQESEADQIGIIYMARAGYDPQQAVVFWERFKAYNQQQGGGSTSILAKFSSTHPLDDVRIADLKKAMPKAEAEYTKSKTQ